MVLIGVKFKSFSIQVGLWRYHDNKINDTHLSEIIYDEILYNISKYAGCEYVIALTHMRTPNDIRLAEQVPEVIFFYF